MGIEKEGVVIHLAIDISLIRKPDVAQTVGRRVATVTAESLEGQEFISIETAQAVPSGEPHETIIVLQQLGDMIRRYAILLVIPRLMILWLCHADSLTDEGNEDERHVLPNVHSLFFSFVAAKVQTSERNAKE